MQSVLSSHHKQNVWALIIAQIMSFGTAPTIIFSGGLIGMALTGDASLATLPVAFVVIGTALFTVPAARLMQHKGRKFGFLIGNVLAVSGCALVLIALWQGLFVLFSLGTMLMGMNFAVMQQYRFAVVEGVPSSYHGRLVAWLIFSSLFGAIIVLQSVSWSKDLLDIAYVGSYALLGTMLLIAHVSLWFYGNVKSNNLPQAEEQNQTREGIQLSRQVKFIFAVVTGTLGYCMMSFVMTATPLYMKIQLDYDTASSAFVIMCHMIAMFSPSLFTGWLIERLGIIRLIQLGMGMLLAAATVNVLSESYAFILTGLIALGVGWNFMFVGATVYLTKNFTGANRFRVQGWNELFIFSGQALVSLLSGWFLFAFGWFALNWILVPLVLVLLVFSFKRELG